MLTDCTMFGGVCQILPERATFLSAEQMYVEKIDFLIGIVADIEYQPVVISVDFLALSQHFGPLQITSVEIGIDSFISDAVHHKYSFEETAGGPMLSDG